MHDRVEAPPFQGWARLWCLTTQGLRPGLLCAAPLALGSGPGISCAALTGLAGSLPCIPRVALRLPWALPLARFQRLSGVTRGGGWGVGRLVKKLAVRSPYPVSVRGCGKCGALGSPAAAGSPYRWQARLLGGMESRNWGFGRRVKKLAVRSPYPWVAWVLGELEIRRFGEARWWECGALGFPVAAGSPYPRGPRCEVENASGVNDEADYLHLRGHGRVYAD